MKTPFSISRLRAPFKKRAAVGVHPQSRRGIALIITLIMISVTLVMAVAFLALARRERVSVSTTTDTVSAKLAADSALAAAQAQIMANVFVTNSSLYNFNLFVSTDYQNGYGYNTANYADPTNVNYDYINGGGALTTPELIQNIANLKYLPRVPVYITNSITGGTDFRFYLDLNRNGRFETNGVVGNFSYTGTHLDGDNVAEVGDPEWVGILSRPDMAHSANNQFVSRYAFIAIPIGNTLDINAIHNQARSQDLNTGNDGYFRNEGVGSWEINLAAFLADLNTNQWDPPTAENTGVGSYNYLQANNNLNNGRSFEDALSILNYRYNGLYANLVAPSKFLYNALVFNGVDGYTYGNLLTTTNLPSVRVPPGVPTTSAYWVGSDNTNRFFDLPDELFSVTNAAVNNNNFTKSLLAAGTNVSTYDRYTYYRLLSQLGTDSDPDAGKMNLNYSNILVSYNPQGVATGISDAIPGAETNCVPWRPVSFFTAAADRLLRQYSTNWFASNPSNYLATFYGLNYDYFHLNAFGVLVTNDPTGFGLTNVPFFGMTNQLPVIGMTNIPVYINGQFVYTAAVNRLLQLAANLYDSSTTNFYPTIFRPLFGRDSFDNIYIIGYTNIASAFGINTLAGIDSTADFQLSLPYTIAQLTNMARSFPTFTPVTDGTHIVNVYGVPWIIGSKKGFPSFNKFGMQENLQIWRRLQIKRDPNTLSDNPPKLSYFIITNQLYDFSISNMLGIDCWNSYSNTYVNPVYISVNDTLSMWITNSYGAPASSFSYDLISTNIAVNSWAGYRAGAGDTANAQSFVVPIQRPVVLLTNSAYYFGTTPPGVQGFYPDLPGQAWETSRGTFDLPRFGLQTTNRLQVSMVDFSNGVYHLLDYVQLTGPEKSLDVDACFQTNFTTAGYTNMWSTNLDNAGLPYGIKSQLYVSEGSAGVIDTFWNNNPSPGVPGATAQEEIDGFCQFLGLASPFPDQPANNPGQQYYATNSVVQVPYTPLVTISDYLTYQANDPQVHYLASDLSYSGKENGNNLSTGVSVVQQNLTPLVSPSYSIVNARYQPWGVNPLASGYSSVNGSGYDTNAFNLGYKDPAVWGSDNWDFPTNKYPTVGWLGRVHRGTPWQTVYLKADNILTNSIFGPGTGTNTWEYWTGDSQLAGGHYFDAANTAPLQDRLLFDMFTARFNDNAAMGTLSVNQTNLAAWSALLSGVVVLTNTDAFPPFNIAPPTTPPGLTNNWMVVQPAGINGNSTLGFLVTNINNARTNFINMDGLEGVFEHKADILSTEAFTERSPFLNWNNINQQKFGINDEAYEWLPQQTLGLLRAPVTPRYLIFCYGQALRPAPNALVTDATGGQFGLCTNYQVVAESGVRAIVSVQPQVQIMVSSTGSGPVTNYTMKVESYNVLPPN